MGKLRQEINGNSADQAGSGRTATTWVINFKLSRCFLLSTGRPIDCHHLFPQHKSSVLHNVQMNDNGFAPCFSHRLTGVPSESTFFNYEI